MAQLEDEHNKSLIKFLQDKNEQLKDLVEELYDMTCLDDMIDEWRSGADDEMLLCYLSLKSQVMEALGGRKLVNNIKFKNTEAKLKIEDVAKLKHNSSKVVANHYSKEDK